MAFKVRPKWGTNDGVKPTMWVEPGIGKTKATARATARAIAHHYIEHRSVTAIQELIIENARLKSVLDKQNDDLRRTRSSAVNATLLAFVLACILVTVGITVAAMVLA